MVRGHRRGQWDAQRRRERRVKAAGGLRVDELRCERRVGVHGHVQGAREHAGHQKLQRHRALRRRFAEERARCLWQGGAAAGVHGGGELHLHVAREVYV